MRILLIKPDDSPSTVGFTAMVRTEPLALEVLAAAVPHHEVKILDLRVESSLKETLSSFAPDLVGVTGYTTEVHRMQDICATVKSMAPEVVTVVGGHHASLVPEDFDRDYVDVIVVGAGETTFPELVDTLEANRRLHDVEGIIFRQDERQVRNKPRWMPRSMDDLPLPARHLVDHYREHYHFHFWDNPYLVETARGCPFRCTFCSVWHFYEKRCHQRSPELVVEDLKQVKSDIVCFADDNFLISRERAERLCDKIRQAGLDLRYWAQVRSDSIARWPQLVKEWAEVGLHTVLVGFESVHQKDLADINKQNTTAINEQAMEILHQYGIDMWGAFMVDPQWTREDFDELIEYVRQKKIRFPQFTIMTPLPGTVLFQEKFNELVTHNYELFDLFHAALPTRLPLEEFYENMARLYSSTTLGLAEIRRRIRSGHIPIEALRRMRGLLRDVTDPQTYLEGRPVAKAG